ncbi:hypothetical protein FA15DRAFT_643399 [Coprinopsis marcescibilis]|uniref:BTB domain-containing protein n=1 Tax=Coprinopsis marcescibilis TaxID=230819 RepID=A0A5C3KR33_COPMA|nr:hypothetical protein FA15DRAFT_643399 [Coprinopsis marcescibilis]
MSTGHIDKKRKRTSLGQQSHDGASTSTEKPHSTCIRSPSCWFEDGNIVIRAENTLFRVHKSILSIQSTVLCDTFSVPQPMVHDPESESEGCLVLEFNDDSSADWTHVLELIYYGLQLSQAHESPSFSAISAMIRLGHKYDFQALLSEGIKRFGNAFPCHLDRYTAAPCKDNDDVTIFGESTSLFDAINLAHKMHLERSLPALYATAICHPDFPLILFTGTTSNDGNISRISPDLVQTLILARDRFYVALKDSSLSWLFSGAIPSPSPACLNNRACKNARLKLVEEVFTPLPKCAYLLQRFDRAKLAKGFCTTCTGVAERLFDTARRHAWSQVPQMFGLPPWAELKDLNFD